MVTVYNFEVIYATLIWEADNFNANTNNVSYASNMIGITWYVNVIRDLPVKHLTLY